MSLPGNLSNTIAKRKEQTARVLEKAIRLEASTKTLHNGARGRGYGLQAHGFPCLLFISTFGRRRFRRFSKNTTPTKHRILPIEAIFLLLWALKQGFDRVYALQAEGSDADFFRPCLRHVSESSGHRPCSASSTPLY